jgi:hypothetical protein
MDCPALSGYPEIITNAPEETRRLKNPFRFVVTYRGDTYTLTPDDVFGICVIPPNMRTKSFYFIHEEDRDTVDAWRSDLTQSSIYRKIKLYDILLTVRPNLRLNRRLR